VLLSSDGLVQIADFGHCASSVTTYGVNRDCVGQTMCALAPGMRTRQQLRMTSCGCTRYFSPERVNGSNFRCTPHHNPPPTPHPHARARLS
jgi:serine/threonine protein kinase